jgi:hypothetical protein
MQGWSTEARGARAVAVGGCYWSAILGLGFRVQGWGAGFRVASRCGGALSS